MPTQPTTRFPYYVYDLIDPRDDTIFYVGSGTGDRHKHSAETYDGAVSKAKLKRIYAIKAAGLAVRSVIVMSFKTRAEALMFEYERQRRFKLPNTPASMPRNALQGRPPVDAWCGYPTYGRRCGFLPLHCVPAPLPPGATSP